MTRAIGEQDYSNLAQDLHARASKQGATGADVMVADGETLSVQVRMGAVDRLTKAREKRLGLRVFFGQRSASASTSDFSRDSLERFVGETILPDQLSWRRNVRDHRDHAVGGRDDQPLTRRRGAHRIPKESGNPGRDSDA